MLNARLQYRNVAAFAGIVHHDGTATNGVVFADANKPLIAYVELQTILNPSQWILVSCKRQNWKSPVHQFYVDKTPERKGMVMEVDKNSNSVGLAGGRDTWLRTDDGKAVVNQIILRESEKIPENSTIHNINLQVVFGRVGLRQNDTEEIIYTSGNRIDIPAKTIICLSNQFDKESTVYIVRI